MTQPWLKHIPTGVPSEVKIPEISLNELMNSSFEEYANLTAITFMNQTYTYEELNQLIDNAAAAFIAKGINKEDKIALMLPNSLQYVISYFATLLCGATVVQINPMYQSNELLHVLNDSEAKLLIVLEDLYPVVQAIEDKTSIEEVINVSFKNKTSFDELMRDKDIQAPEVDIDPQEDVAVIQYTGGTTGRSKGAMLTHYNLVANTLQSYATSKIRLEKGKERTLAITPFFHVYGMTGVLNLTLYTGGNLIILPRFDINETVKTIEAVRPTYFSGVPTMFIGLLNYYRKHNLDLNSFKNFTSGSAPLPVEILETYNKKIGVSIVEGYGLSEASPATHRNPVKGLQKPGSIGFPLPNTDAKIVDSENKDIVLPPGEVGELAVKGPQIMKGYLNLPEETAEVLQDGWLYTGDLAKMDEDGYFYIVGRKKELIIASGFNVYPIEIEDVLYEHDNVLEVAVIGVPDKYRGETIKAVIVLRNGEEVTEEELELFCRQRLAAYKVPEKFEFVDKLPKSAVGKILKRKLN